MFGKKKQVALKKLYTMEGQDVTRGMCLHW